MSPDQIPTKVSPSVPKEGQDRKLKPPPPDHHSKCPRCDSPNTKFCYYNNYSLSQPRHFCKTCRRYWTKGGALRNVPIGGGCRKNKKMKQRLAGISNSRDSSSCEIMGSSSGVGLNFFQGFLTPAMDFQLGSSNPHPPTTSSMFPISGTDANFTLYDQHYHGISPLNLGSHHPVSGAVPTLIGFDYRSSQSGGGGEHGALQMSISSNNSMIAHSNLASSIESLSSINQELHLKLQQQRLSVLFSGGGDQSEKLKAQSDMAHVEEHQFVDHQDQQQPQSQTHKIQLQPILFQNLETGKEADPFSTSESRIEDREALGKSRLGENNAGSATEWFFDVNPYSDGRNNNNEGLNIDEDNDNQTTRNWNTGGIQQAWSNMRQQYDGALP